MEGDWAGVGGGGCLGRMGFVYPGTSLYSWGGGLEGGECRRDGESEVTRGSKQSNSN